MLTVEGTQNGDRMGNAEKIEGISVTDGTCGECLDRQDIGVAVAAPEDRRGVGRRGRRVGEIATPRKGLGPVPPLE